MSEKTFLEIVSNHLLKECSKCGQPDSQGDKKHCCIKYLRSEITFLKNKEAKEASNSNIKPPSILLRKIKEVQGLVVAHQQNGQKLTIEEEFIKMRDEMPRMYQNIVDRQREYCEVMEKVKESEGLDIRIQNIEKELRIDEKLRNYQLLEKDFTDVKEQMKNKDEKIEALKKQIELIQKQMEEIKISKTEVQKLQVKLTKPKSTEPGPQKAQPPKLYEEELKTQPVSNVDAWSDRLSINEPNQQIPSWSQIPSQPQNVVNQWFNNTTSNTSQIENNQQVPTIQPNKINQVDSKMVEQQQIPQVIRNEQPKDAQPIMPELHSNDYDDEVEGEEKILAKPKQKKKKKPSKKIISIDSEASKITPMQEMQLEPAIKCDFPKLSKYIWEQIQQELVNDDLFFNKPKKAWEPLLESFKSYVNLYGLDSFQYIELPKIDDISKKKDCVDVYKDLKKLLLGADYFGTLYIDKNHKVTSLLIINKLDCFNLKDKNVQKSGKNQMAEESLQREIDKQISCNFQKFKFKKIEEDIEDRINEFWIRLPKNNDLTKLQFMLPDQ